MKLAMMNHVSFAAMAMFGLVGVPQMAIAQAVPTGEQLPAPPAQADPSGALPGGTQAESAGSGTLEDIVVTAQRRSENLQRVPIAVSVATSGELRASGVGGVTDLKIVAPGVEVQSNAGASFPIIRGVASKALGGGVESPVAIYVDGVYYANAYANILSFNNIEQVEVLKGPQGTLFGRNATGGLIQIRTRDPKHAFGGDLNVSYGNYQTLVTNAYLTGGLSETLAADIAFSSTNMGDGYGTNLVNGKDVYKTFHDYNVRSKLLFTPAEGTEIRLSGDYQDQKSSMFAQRVPLTENIPAPYPANFGGKSWDINTDAQPLLRLRQGGATLRIDQDLRSVKLIDITAYRKSRLNNYFDFDYTPILARINQFRLNDHQFSQELQLQSSGNSALTWLVGGYYFKASSGYPSQSIIFGGPARIPTVPPTVLRTTLATQKTDSLAGFGQATLEILAGLRATVGLRYTSEKRTLADAIQLDTRSDGSEVAIVPLNTRSLRFRKLTWRFGVDYAITPDVLGYATFNRGFRAGGFNPISLTVPPYNPEVLDAYEVGLKSTLFDRRVRLNLAGYHYNYKDVQVQRAVANGTGIANGAVEKIYGLDAELQYQVTPELNLNLGYQYIHARYEDFVDSVVSTRRPAGGFALGIGDVSGNTGLLAPKSTITATVNYQVPLDTSKLDLNFSYYYNSGYFQEPDNVLRQPAYSLFNASAVLRIDNGLSVGVWGRNLSNRAVANLNGLISFGGFALARASYAPPRTYGVSAGYKF